MRAQRKQRLWFVVATLTCVAFAVGLSLYAVSKNINLFFSPTQVVQGKAPKHHLFRLGGMVKKGSIHYADKGLEVSFVLTDYKSDVTVHYHGILPDLFREGQGIVTQGKLNNKGLFVASIVLAKHGSKYMPRVVKEILYKHKGSSHAT